MWVVGCSTGQEAYSIAMAFTEVAENAHDLRKLQVFATDLYLTPGPWSDVAPPLMLVDPTRFAP